MNLQDVFEKQKQLNKLIVPGLYKDLDEKKMTEWVIKLNLGMQQEQAELVDSLDWKWWKKGEFNLNNAKVEIVDIMHFVVSIATVLGMDADEFLEIYAKKHALNNKRQENGYQDGTYEKVIDGVEDNVREVLG